MFSFAYGHLIFPAPYVEKVKSSSTELLWNLCQNRTHTVVWVYFWVLHSVALIYVCDPLPTPHCPYYWAVRSWLWVDWLFPLLFLFHKIALVILGSLHFYTNFRISLCIFTKYAYWANPFLYHFLNDVYGEIRLDAHGTQEPLPLPRFARSTLGKHFVTKQTRG